MNYDYVKKYFEDWNWWDWTWVITATIISLWLALQWGGSALSIITGLTGIWCVILVAKGRIFNYYLGIINVLGYAWIAYQQQFYGEVMLNAGYFLPMQFVGLYIWMKNKNTAVADSVIIKFMSNKNRLFWASISVAAVFFYGLILVKMKGNLPFFDSVSTVLSVIAMILMAWRYMEQWILWIVVDIVSIYMWWVVVAEGGRDITILIMWSAFLINAVYGLVLWIKMYKEQKICIK